MVKVPVQCLKRQATLPTLKICRSFIFYDKDQFKRYNHRTVLAKISFIDILNDSITIVNSIKAMYGMYFAIKQYSYLD